MLWPSHSLDLTPDEYLWLILYMLDTTFYCLWKNTKQGYMIWRCTVPSSLENLCQRTSNLFSKDPFTPNLTTHLIAHLIWCIWAVNKILYAVG